MKVEPESLYRRLAREYRTFTIPGRCFGLDNRYFRLGFGATADYPTLALDGNAVYIGTNNFAPASAGGTNSFRGTTLNVIPLDSVFNAGAPTVANMKQFVTPLATGVDNGSGRDIHGTRAGGVCIVR